LNSLYDDDDDDAVEGAGDAEREGMGNDNSEDVGEETGMARTSFAVRAR